MERELVLVVDFGGQYNQLMQEELEKIMCIVK